MSIFNPALTIPDSLLAKEATEILREHSTDLLFNHSIRVYLFAAEQGRQQKLRFDTELLCVAAAFHDLDLIEKFSSQNERFEVDDANAARQFLRHITSPKSRCKPPRKHCPAHHPGVTQYMRPELPVRSPFREPYFTHAAPRESAPEFHGKMRERGEIL